MDIKELREYLNRKTWLGRRIFGNYYLAHYGLKRQEAQNLIDNRNATAFVIYYRNEDDIKHFWQVAKEVDSMEEELVNAIEDLRFCRPISWQYDFVENVSSLVGVNLLQTLETGAVADAYCMAKINKLNLTDLIADLDTKYGMIFASTEQKINLLRRNFSLQLETMAPNSYYGNSKGLNFRELVDRYVPMFGVKGLVEALKKAHTPETKLTSDENTVMAMAYYSLYFPEDADGIAPHVPGRLTAACVADRLDKEQIYLEKLRNQAGRFGNDDEDDANDEIKKILAQTHSPVYLDPTERCLIDVQYGTSPLYAHVYIEKFPEDDLNNSLPDFIQYKKGCLFTVEFVEDIKALEVAEELNKKLNAIKHELVRLEKACVKNQDLLNNPLFQSQYRTMKRLLGTCFYIS